MGEKTEHQMPSNCPSRLKGSLIERGRTTTQSQLREILLPERAKENKEQSIAKHVECINTRWKEHKDKLHASWAEILGGNTSIHMNKTDVSLHVSRQTAEEYQYKGHSFNKRTFARPWNTDSDLKYLTEKSPKERYKFYLSLNDGIQSQYKDDAQQFVRDLLAECAERKTSIMTKTEDHLYDSFDIYTWDKEEMISILQMLYPRYRHLFQAVPRVFQEEIAGIPGDHVGSVQEPVGGHKNESHSGRMELLGRYFDTQNIDVITSDIFVRGCVEAGVQPEAPWFVA